MARLCLKIKILRKGWVGYCLPRILKTLDLIHSTEKKALARSVVEHILCIDPQQNTQPKKKFHDM
jgi:hypothetical protein